MEELKERRWDVDKRHTQLQGKRDGLGTVADAEVRELLVRYQVLEQLSGDDDPSSASILRAQIICLYLFGLHRHVDETARPKPESGLYQRQIEEQAEDEDRGIRCRLPDPFHAIREALHAVRSGY